MKAKTANIIVLSVIGLVILFFIGSGIYGLYHELVTNTRSTLAFLAVEGFACFLIYCIYKSNLGDRE